MRFVVGACLLVGCYSPGYRDCEVTCDTENHACPSGFSCDMSLGVCREQGVQGACGGGSGSSVVDGAVDAKQCFGFTLATNFDPCVVMDSNGDTTIDQTVIYNTDSGMIVGASLPGFDAGQMVDQPSGPRVRALRFGDLHITSTGTLQISGGTPLLFVVHTMHIEGALDLNGATALPFTNCTATEGASVNFTGGGGGGGGFAAMGGNGGQAGPAATNTGRALGGAMIASSFSPLYAGCPGRNGGGSNGGTFGVGGAAGGAVQITARDSITVSGSIRANGAGGAGATAVASPICTPSGVCGGGGGGGGAGGLILLEAPTVTIGSSARLCANGGGGGGGAGSINGGSAGIAAGGALLCANTSPAGGDGAGGGAGGVGGSVVGTSGRPGGDGFGNSDSGGGGGGGAIGHIGVHATMPMISTPLVASPAIETLP